MKKNIMMAAVVVAAMCGGAYASEKALETLSTAAGAETVREIPEAVPSAEGGKADEQRGGSAVYSNPEGCVVTAEQRQNGVMLYVQDGRGAQATLAFLKDHSGGDIFSFCSPAKAELNGKILTLSCGEQNNGGYHTRGAAVIEMDNGITGVAVRGEVKRALGWKTDTDISCGGLKADAARTFGGAKDGSFTYRGMAVADDEPLLK